MSREAHAEAVMAAIEMIKEIGQATVALKERQQNVLGVIAEATGGADCPVDGGRISFEYTAALGERITEIAAMTDNIEAALNMYLGGF